ncbi:MAG TPA: HAD family hydrolase [Nitrososphaeria archaeon]|nr:HAD family hydrolase [Nitrososphaeria archaeon]
MRQSSYRILGEGILVSAKSLEELGDLDAIIFDCDGTLIDVEESYYLTTRLTAAIILKEIYGIEVKLGRDVNQVIKSLKMLGGFNDESNTVSIIAQTILTFSPKEHVRHGKLSQVDIATFLGDASRDRSEPEFVLDALRWIKDKCSELYGEYVTRADLEDLLDEVASSKGREKILSDFRVNICGEPPSDILPRLFDEIFEGEEMIKKFDGEPKYVRWDGAIKNDKLLIREDTLRDLSEMFDGRMGILSGRRRLEAEYTLNDLLKYFDPKATIFSDDPTWCEKPDPTGFIRCSRLLNADKILYVGDSSEDLLMVKKASEKGLNSLMASVLTNDFSFNYFIKMGADIIMEDVNLLPKALSGRPWSPFKLP